MMDHLDATALNVDVPGPKLVAATFRNKNVALLVSPFSY